MPLAYFIATSMVEPTGGAFFAIVCRRRAATAWREHIHALSLISSLFGFFFQIFVHNMPFVIALFLFLLGRGDGFLIRQN